MKTRPDTVHQIYFSPTRTTETVLDAVAQGVQAPAVRKSNLAVSDFPGEIPDDELVIIGAPVYSGRLPRLFCDRIKGLRGKNTPAVILVAYGNREFDDSLLELHDIMKDKGFRIIAAAAFIGEHSFSSAQYPIAAGRPDIRDLDIARNFGKDIADVLSGGIPDSIVLDIPGNRPYKELRKGTPVSPVTDGNCVYCMLCVKACPSGAIDETDPFITNAEKCIKCAACIKVCKQDARKFTNDGVLASTIKLYTNCQARKEPQLYVPTGT